MQEVEKKDGQQNPKPDTTDAVSGGFNPVVDGGCIPDPFRPLPVDFPENPAGPVEVLTVLPR
jgi:hypothetical protein